MSPRFRRRIAGVTTVSLARKRPFILVAMVCASASYAWAAEEGLVLHYAFDEGHGTRVADASPSRNHGILKGRAKWAAGLSGKALDFGGESAYVEVPASDSLGLQNATMAGWFFVRKRGGGISFSTGIMWPDERLVLLEE